MNEDDLRQRIAEARLQALAYQPFGIGHLLMASRSDLGFGLGVAVAIMAAIIGSIAYFGADGRAQQQAEMAEFRAYMRECVPKMPASRCKEIYRWTMEWRVR